MYFGMIGGFLFILIQLILIIDFAHSWAEAWVGNYEDGENKGWLVALSTVTFAFYAGSLTAIGKINNSRLIQDVRQTLKMLSCPCTTRFK